MDFELSKNYRVLTDRNQIILYRKATRGEKAKNPGQEHWIHIGFYSHMDSLIQDLPDKVLLNTDTENLVDVIKEIKEIGKELRRQIQV